MQKQVVHHQQIWVVVVVLPPWCPLCPCHVVLIHEDYHLFQEDMDLLMVRAKEIFLFCFFLLTLVFSSLFFSFLFFSFFFFLFSSSGGGSRRERETQAAEKAAAAGQRRKRQKARRNLERSQSMNDSGRLGQLMTPGENFDFVVFLHFFLHFFISSFISSFISFFIFQFTKWNSPFVFFGVIIILHLSGPGIPPRITLDDLGPEGLNMSGGMGGSSVLEQIAMNARGGGGGEEERDGRGGDYGQSRGSSMLSSAGSMMGGDAPPPQGVQAVPEAFRQTLQEREDAFFRELYQNPNLQR